MWSYMKLGPVGQDKMLFKEKNNVRRVTDARRTPDEDRSQYLTLILWLRWAKNTLKWMCDPMFNLIALR